MKLLNIFRFKKKAKKGLSRRNLSTGEEDTERPTASINTSSHRKVVLPKEVNADSFFKWYSTFLEEKQLRIIVHNFNRIYGAGYYTLLPAGYTGIIHYLKYNEELTFAEAAGVPLMKDGSVDQSVRLRNRQDFKKNPKKRRSFWGSEVPNGLKMLDALKAAVEALGYDSSENAELLAEFLKYDYCMAMYYRYKSAYKPYENLPLFKQKPEKFLSYFSLNFNDLFYQIEGSYRIRYSLVAYLAYKLKLLGASTNFANLEELFFKVRQENIKSQRAARALQLIQQNDPDDFSSVKTVNTVCPVSTKQVIDSPYPDQLKRLVERIYTKIGYKTITTRKIDQEGPDVLVISRETGIKTTIQVKQYQSKLDNRAIQSTLEGRAFYGADQAILMTNNHFTDSAIDLARQT